LFEAAGRFVRSKAFFSEEKKRKTFVLLSWFDPVAGDRMAPPMLLMFQATAKVCASLTGETNMMMEHRWTALVTLLALLVYFLMSVQVGRARGKSGIHAPAMTGDPMLERAVRVHYNTLEWLPIFLVSLWLFAIYWNEMVAAGLGTVWIIGRLVYAASYMADPAKRSTGFMIQFLAGGALLLGALGKIVYSLATGGAG
jgi:glutathione S-transferase